MRSPLVLLVEDEALIALALADDLETAGYQVAGPFHRSSDTLSWLEHQTPDVAIIDVHLRDGSSIELARVLRERGVPFVVFSGERRSGQFDDAFGASRWLSSAARRSRGDSSITAATASRVNPSSLNSRI